MRWLSRLLNRSTPAYTPRRVDELSTVEEAVELEGVVEAVEVLQDPLSGEPAVVLNYLARRPAAAQLYFSIQANEGDIEAYQATNFVIRDDSGAALIEVAQGTDIAKLHAELLERFGVNLEAEIERVGPGERIRVRGRVRRQATGGSPHRREAWTAVVTLDELEDPT